MRITFRTRSIFFTALACVGLFLASGFALTAAPSSAEAQSSRYMFTYDSRYPNPINVSAECRSQFPDDVEFAISGDRPLVIDRETGSFIFQGVNASYELYRINPDGTEDRIDTGGWSDYSRDDKPRRWLYDYEYRIEWTGTVDGEGLALERTVPAPFSNSKSPYQSTSCNTWGTEFERVAKWGFQPDERRFVVGQNTPHCNSVSPATWRACYVDTGSEFDRAYNHFIEGGEHVFRIAPPSPASRFEAIGFDQDDQGNALVTSQGRDDFQVVFDYISQCEDGIDNDGDGQTDYGSDPDCRNQSDDNEEDTDPEVTLTISPQSVEFGGSATLSWTSQRAENCTASGGWNGSKSLAGSQVISSIQQNTTFVLSCSNNDGSASDSAQVVVKPGDDQAVITVSGNLDLSGAAWSLTDVGTEANTTANQTYTYVVTPPVSGKTYTLTALQQQSGYTRAVTAAKNDGTAESVNQLFLRPGDTATFDVVYTEELCEDGTAEVRFSGDDVEFNVAVEPGSYDFIIDGDREERLPTDCDSGTVYTFTPDTFREGEEDDERLTTIHYRYCEPSTSGTWSDCKKYVVRDADSFSVRLFNDALLIVFFEYADMWVDLELTNVEQPSTQTCPQDADGCPVVNTNISLRWQSNGMVEDSCEATGGLDNIMEEYDMETENLPENGFVTIAPFEEDREVLRVRCRAGRGSYESNDIVIHVHAAASNGAPDAVDDSESVERDAAGVLLPVLSNDSDPDGDEISISAINMPPQHGEASINGDKISYTPNSGFVGTDVFEYTISDGNGGQDSAQVVVSVVVIEDFSISVNPQSMELRSEPGTRESVEVVVSRYNGFSEAVDLSLSIEPSGGVGNPAISVEWDFELDPVPGGETHSLLTATVLDSLNSGDYVVTITGISGTLGSRHRSFILTVGDARDFHFEEF